MFSVRSFSGRRRERASAPRAHEQPCLFVLRDWKWRRAETKTITCVCERDCAVIETLRPPARDPRSYLRLTAAAGVQVEGGQERFFVTRFGFITLVS